MLSSAKTEVTEIIESDMEIEIPIDEPVMSVQLLCLDTYGTDPITKLRTARTNLVWIHREKQPRNLDPSGQRDRGVAEYKRELPIFLAAFKKLLCEFAWDVLLQAPSSKPHARSFADAARELRKDTPSLIFSKRAEVSATTGASLAEIKAALSHEPQIALQQYSRVLVVDDVFTAGKPVAAMILYLREHGLQPDAKVTVAVALHVPRAPH